jgi:hypothetical protein
MRYCLLFLAATIFLFSCKETEVPKSKSEILREGKWWIDTTVVAFHKPLSDTDSVYGFKPIDCRKDDRLAFRTAGEGGHTTNKERCGAELDEYAFTWGILENDTKMYLYNVESFLGEDVNAKLKEFTDSKFVIVYDRYVIREDTTFHVDTSEYTVTFKKF